MLAQLTCVLLASMLLYSESLSNDHHACGKSQTQQSFLGLSLGPWYKRCSMLATCLPHRQQESHLQDEVWFGLDEATNVLGMCEHNHV